MRIGTSRAAVTIFKCFIVTSLIVSSCTAIPFVHSSFINFDLNIFNFRKAPQFLESMNNSPQIDDSMKEFFIALFLYSMEPSEINELRVENALANIHFSSPEEKQLAYEGWSILKSLHNGISEDEIALQMEVFVGDLITIFGENPEIDWFKMSRV